MNFLAILFLLIPYLAIAQCESPTPCDCTTNGNLLVTQAQVNAFGALGCTELTGSLSINDGFDGVHDITDLTPLGSIRKIGNDLVITNSDVLVSLDGLAIDSIADGLFIGQNDVLDNISALSTLECVKDIAIGGHPVLTGLDGLQNVDCSLSSLNISGNTLLTDCAQICAFTYDTPSSLANVHNNFNFIPPGPCHNLRNQAQISAFCAVLPVGAITLEAEAGMDAVGLSWSTDRVDATQQFTLYRSSDAVNFIEIGNTPAGSYTYTDQSVQQNQTYFYSVRQKFDDNTEWVSNRVEAKTGIRPLEQLVAYPTILQEELKFNLPVTGTIELFDMNGKSIRFVEVSSQTSISVSDLAQGRYIVRVHDYTMAQDRIFHVLKQ